jgi:hypothetical protein
MWAYELISEATGVPLMADLGEPYVMGPTARGGVFSLTFPKDFGRDVVRYEPAVGVPCHVVRTRDEEREECKGAVNSVEPLRVTLDGAGWKPSQS